MGEQQHNLCEGLVDYLAGTCSTAEREQFEAHLANCPDCRRELSELRTVWEALPLQPEEAEVPADLKQQVMDGIFGSGAEAPLQVRQDEPVPSRSVFRRISRWLYPAGTAAAAFLLLWLGAMAWNSLGGKETASPSQADDGPARVVRTIALKPTYEAKPDCGGTVYQMRKDASEQMVVRLHGLPPTNGTETYQVWLIHEGTRYNGGTLVVNDQGEGVLVYTVKKDDPTFEAVGVTLEPDAKGTAPRGRKMLGS